MMVRNEPQHHLSESKTDGLKSNNFFRGWDTPQPRVVVKDRVFLRSERPTFLHTQHARRRHFCVRLHNPEDLTTNNLPFACVPCSQVLPRPSGTPLAIRCNSGSKCIEVGGKIPDFLQVRLQFVSVTFRKLLLYEVRFTVLLTTLFLSEPHLAYSLKARLLYLAVALPFQDSRLASKIELGFSEPFVCL